MFKTQSYSELEKIILPEKPINIFVWGESGIGKTSAIIDIAEKLGIPIVRINMSFNTDYEDLLGGVRIKDGATFYEPGPVVDMMQRGGILLLDECDSSDLRVLFEMHGVLERKPVYVKKWGKVVEPHKNFRVIATGNTNGEGDTTGNYGGTTPLNKAFMDRFDAYVNFQSPSREEMTQIIMSHEHCPHRVVAEIISHFYEKIYESIRSGGSDLQHLSARKMLHLASMFNTLVPSDKDIYKKPQQVNDVLCEALYYTFGNLDVGVIDGIKATWNINFDELEDLFEEFLDEDEKTVDTTLFGQFMRATNDNTGNAIVWPTYRKSIFKGIANKSN